MYFYNSRRNYLKTQKAILKKIKEWEGNPMLVAGMYRLFAYLPWVLVPDKYKEFFPEDAKDTWMKDEGNYKEEEILQDIESEIRAILNSIAKKNVTNSLGLIPMILADLFIINKQVGGLQGQLAKTINTFKENIELDRNLAEQLAMFEIFDILRNIIKKAKLKNMSFDFEKALEQVVGTATKITPPEPKNVLANPGIEAKVDEALEKEREKDEADV